MRVLARRPGAVLVTVLLVALAALTCAVAVGWDPLVDLDHEVAQAAFDSSSGHPGRVETWTRVTDWGAPTTWRVALLVAAAGLAATRRWRLAGWLLALTVVESVVAPAAKLLLDRPRPHWPDPIVVAGASSYPSGHATAVTTAAVAGVLLVRRLGGSRLLAAVVAAALGAAAVAVAASRVFLGVHYLSDVVAGLLLGALLATVSLAVAEAVRPARRISRRPRRG